MFSEESIYNAYVASLLNGEGKESEIIGYIMLELNKEKRYSFIQGLFVEEKYRHRGIAKRLINEAENYSRSIGCKVIEAEIRNYLFRFYNELGFSIYEKKNDSFYFVSKNLERNIEKEKDSGWER
ncbi:MAG: GNAT family N-acetyltransferase [Clostridia bacterium]|nr:GNAT family N-acetyltransferase [Clostridia bacterium]